MDSREENEEENTIDVNLDNNGPRDMVEKNIDGWIDDISGETPFPEE